jgi:hypothetical protein
LYCCTTNPPKGGVLDDGYSIYYILATYVAYVLGDTPGMLGNTLGLFPNIPTLFPDIPPMSPNTGISQQA